MRHHGHCWCYASVSLTEGKETASQGCTGGSTTNEIILSPTISATDSHCICLFWERLPRRFPLLGKMAKQLDQCQHSILPSTWSISVQTRSEGQKLHEPYWSLFLPGSAQRQCIYMASVRCAFGLADHKRLFTRL